MFDDIDDARLNNITAEKQSQEDRLSREDEQTDFQSDAMQYAGMAMDRAEGVACHKCGAINGPDAVFCASCGEPLHSCVCPSCGAELDPEADLCEKCHSYVKKDTCSFCGAHLTGDEAYCPECGSPRGGIVCPACHTLNEFAFCKQCGLPLTDEAKAGVAELQTNPDYIELVKLAAQYEKLENNLPFDSEKDKHLDEISQNFRKHVLTLLAKEQGNDDPYIPEPKNNRRSQDEALKQKKVLKLQLTSLFEKMKVPPVNTSVAARNYAMACKPAGMQLGWICNYKHAVHSSPCGCAKPQMGGKWIILGSNQNTKEDK